MRKKKACLKRHATILPLLYRMPTTIVNYFTGYFPPILLQRSRQLDAFFAVKRFFSSTFLQIHLMLCTLLNRRNLHLTNRLLRLTQMRKETTMEAQERRLQCHQKSLFDLDLYETISRRSRYMPALYHRQRRFHRFI